MAESPHGGRAQRQEIEGLQGRAKQARTQLEEPETPGFTEQLEQFTEAANAAEHDAALLERDARSTAEQLGLVRHNVEEAERQLLVPKTVASVSPAVALATVGAGIVALMTVFDLITSPAPVPILARVVVLGAGLIPPPILAWLWRRRLSVGGTFRSPS